MATKKKKPKKAKPPAKPEKTPLKKIENYARDLPCDLSEDELREVALLAAEALAKHDAEIEKQKAAAEHAKAVVKDLAAELRRLSQQVRERTVRRPVACERTFDYDAKTVTDVRTDTGETLFTRPMTEAEAQVDLPFRDVDDEFDDVGEPGEGIGDDANAPAKPKSEPRQKKPKADKKPDGEFEDPGVDGEESDGDEKPDAAE